MSTKVTGIYDARKELGWGKSIIMGLQQCFAMFGATILVPVLTNSYGEGIVGLSASVTLFCAGVATLWFHFITKGKVPVFLGSSFAFLGMYQAIIPQYGKEYATGGVVAAGGLYVILAILIKVLGTKRVMKLFPPAVCGPLIILIGINLAGSAIDNLFTNWMLGIVPILVIIICNTWGKGMIKIIPVLISLIVSYIVAIIMGAVDFSAVGSANWVGLPNFHLPKFNADAIVAGLAVAVAAMVEHVGDVMAIGATCGKNFIADPGLTRTLLGDGIGTSLAGLLGGPANTTYSENTGVVALTRVFDPFVMRIAAVMAIILSLSPKFEAVINSIPAAIIGGISFVLYGMIAATGIRTIVENQVDYVNMRNVLITAIILVSGLGFNHKNIVIGSVAFGGLACAAVFGIILNAILPGKDYEFKED
ncbi:MAG: uracil-xanthine permease family protein [Angelakisella sp.]|jgi:uracil permease|uniref:solute carrier family 23 protein n=1 Tax=Angelakisella sp. TaxID=1935177 RepID=UPI0015A6EE6E|nr:uracil-xanthine permease [Angelakisella sp.]MBS6849609.1 uracil-xanthine permease [Clostridiales bacterium]